MLHHCSLQSTGVVASRAWALKSGSPAASHLPTMGDASVPTPLLTSPAPTTVTICPKLPTVERRSLPGLAHAARAPRIRKGVSSVPAWLRRLHCLVRSHPEDRKGCGHLFEFRNRCILVHGHVGSRSRCALQVRLQDGCTLVGGNLFE